MTQIAQAMRAPEWRTPHANIWKNASTMEERTRGGHTVNLQDQVRAWPTPTASAGGSNSRSKAVTERGHGTNLLGAVTRTMWPTPTASQRNLNESPESFIARAEFWRSSKGYHNHIPLSVLVKMWPTPVAADSHTGRVAYARGNPTLEAAAQRSMWPTPNARDWKDTPGMAETSIDGRNRLDQLARVVYHEERKSWPTPRAMDAENVPSGHRGAEDSLNGAVAREEGMQVRATGQLNPTWVEWLMGFPLTWTALPAYPSSPRRRMPKNGQPDESTD
jgi:DNA (cytosine-5)-methyltransferase 1